ncbi:maleylpyruvate isomerase family mycothiol-dependent enzyme [Streptomyces sp. p1417]|uniref:Maleylpyruvate isomerase family mycothiol-dependent enzyme n=1 Tax=Streptomyces typhae TaxID=2681492 RepID=A0A6L6XBN6_9ACTN|nr:maleylpyruvate isomerase family mycothiol-dependent enzyme [Streptomyces typhae]MVO90669.1 maleylpyruvate isomerase family mycothiol-dependent enzyme [Streptomyces typhae]
MPPAKKRTRSYDQTKIRTAVLTQSAMVREAVAGLTPEQLAAPTRLGDWTVRELVAHLTMVLGSVVRYLDSPEPEQLEVPLQDWPFRTSSASAQVDEDVHALTATGTAPPGALDALFADALDRLADTLPEAPGTRLVPSRFGGMTLADFMVTRTVELIVHTDDLNAALPDLDIPYDRQALAACTRLLADALATKAPGGAVEVRVPPYAVVQCVQGPRHTRGTPPNVVETDPLTWIRLATGRTTWAAEREAARVSASGERADLTALLPIMS